MTKKSKSTARTIDNTNWTINAHSKSYIWAYGEDKQKTLSFITETTEGYGKIGTIYVKNGNNLDIITKYLNFSKGNIKTITNTVKNYYTTQNTGAITIDSNPVAITETYKIAKGGYTINSSDTPEYIYGAKGEYNFTGSGEYGAEIYEEKGNNVYNIDNTLTTGINAVYDFRGNDKYNFSSNTVSSNIVLDFKGNDKYFSKENTKLFISEYKGNDKYNFENSDIFSTDYSGADCYEVSNASRLYLYDVKGKDKYQISNSSVLNQMILDVEGNDKYNVIDCSNLTINESEVNENNKSGKDTYNIISSSSIEINESSKFSGNDAYNFTSVDNSALSSSDEILDFQGSDKYNINTSKNINFTDVSGKDSWKILLSNGLNVIEYEGNDKYKINNSNNITINDNKGNDNYGVLSNSININLVDREGKDKYNLDNSFDLTIKDLAQSSDRYTFNNIHNANITDNGGDDVYKISNSSDITIQNNSAIIMSDKNRDANTFNISNSTFEIYTNKANYNTDNNFISKDSYNINSSSGIIEDYDMANDKYNINKLNGSLIINDFGGNKDSLVVSNLKANNVVFMAGAKWNNSFTLQNTDNSLYIYDEENKGYAAIGSYFKSQNNEYTDFGDGKIESVKAGKKELSGLVNIDELNNIQSAVAGWLKTNNYMSVVDVLDSSKQADIDSLVAVFKGSKTV